ncbi:hypothetical protein [Paenibacillus sp.]|uniref:hypothetical protein n=1 Tax=Paenibacillus sp. TaxID=58172 RepID=UPI002D43438F|nr:hypothetical protein [Paenibacillus sp.]HZG58405.1 hypothetical protein [Paenibacillus sp.]
MTYPNNSNAADQDIYILLTDTGTYFTRLIKAFTAAPYNHASIALDAGLKELYSFGRKRPTDPWRAGFIEEDIAEGTYRHFPETRCALLRYRVTKRQRAAIARTIRRFQERKDGLRYNFIGLFGVLLGFELAPRDAYFCSQFVSEVLRRGEAALWDRPSALVAPNDFLQHPALERVYEGYLRDYPLLDRRREASDRVGMTAAGYQVNNQAV